MEGLKGGVLARDGYQVVLVLVLLLLRDLSCDDPSYLVFEVDLAFEFMCCYWLAAARL